MTTHSFVVDEDGQRTTYEVRQGGLIGYQVRRNAAVIATQHRPVMRYFAAVGLLFMGIVLFKLILLSIEIDPNYPSAHQWYGEYLSNMGRFDEAIAELKRALEIDPLSPIINVALGPASTTIVNALQALADCKVRFVLDVLITGACSSAGSLDALAGVLTKWVNTSPAKMQAIPVRFFLGAWRSGRKRTTAGSRA